MFWENQSGVSHTSPPPSVLLRLSCSPSPDRIPQLTAAIDLVNEISKQLTDRKNDAVAEISNTFEELEKAMHLRKNALIAEVENICSTKQKVSPALLCPAPVNSPSLESVVVVVVYVVVVVVSELLLVR